MADHEFITAWRSFRKTRRPYIFSDDEDETVFKDPKARKQFKKLLVSHSWRSYRREPNFGEPDTRFHVGLLPMPFVGNLSKASVYLLSLNPGLGPHDYFGEYKVPAYRRALLRNLRQTPRNADFLFLDRRFSWHGGFRYWHKKLRLLIGQLSHEMGNSANYGTARETLQREIAAIEMVPYHSERFGLSQHIGELPSVGLARRFVTEVLGPRARKGECLVVVMRKATEWGLAEGPNVVWYSGVEAQSAHLTPKSSGGKAILNFLRGKLTR